MATLTNYGNTGKLANTKIFVFITGFVINNKAYTNEHNVKTT